jgi:hypothetical protein
MRPVWGPAMHIAHYALAIGLALLAAVPQAVAKPFQFTSEEAGYSITFPAQPQQEKSQENNARTVLNAVNHDEGYYAVVHVDHPYDLSADDELEGNISKFTQKIGAPTQMRKKRKFAKAPGEQLPAEEFTFESTALVGKGIVVVDGRRTYMVVAFATKPHNRKATIDRFVASFKFKAPPKPKDAAPKVVTKGKAKE